MTDLEATEVTNLISDSLPKYQTAIASKIDFSNPAKVEEVNNLVNEVDVQIPIDFIKIGKGILHGNESISESNLVIKNQTDWERLLTKMNSVKNNVSDSFTETIIDFDKYIVIVNFGGGNYSTTIDIVRIYENDTKVVLIIDKFIQGLTQDYQYKFHIVKIPITDKPISFKTLIRIK